MSKDTLNDIIEKFSPEGFVDFFRSKNRSFKPFTENLQQYNDDNFSDAFFVGEIPFDNVQKLGIYAFRVTKDLTERSSKKAQYEKGKKIIKETNSNAGIFIFYDANGNFRFSLIYIDYLNSMRRFSNFKRFTFFVSPSLTNKTFLQQIGECIFSNLEEIKEAFSVEPVTKQFYAEIQNWYFWAMDKVEFPDDEEKDKEQRNAKSLIRLITRIIFIWFMKEKNLVPSTLFDKSFIAKFLDYKDKTGSTYYKAVLQNLFFATLNTEMKKDNPKSRIFIDEAKKFGYMNDGYLEQGYYRYSRFIKNRDLFLQEFQNIPFLNGGLFECLDKRIEDKEIRVDCFSDNPKNERRLSVPDELFLSENEKAVDLSKYLEKGKKRKVSGLLTILRRYNFTIDENTPIDQEVALDPELLGKVFENLLASYNPETATTARNATGSYYTPREIVDYMVEESLVEYLKDSLNSDKEETTDKIRLLLDYHDEENPFSDEQGIVLKLIDAIEGIKILDPACGSGAFPMGLLHKLVLVLHKLDPENKTWKTKLLEKVPYEIREETEISLKNKSLDYIRKLGLIEHCIYGVDIQEIAIQISKLRFFISLLVEQQVDDTKPNRDIRALPNLETKFVAANTLIDLEKLPEGLFDSAVSKIIKKLFDIREDFFYANSRAKKNKLEENEDKLKETLIKTIQNNVKVVNENKVQSLEKEIEKSNNELNKLNAQPDEVVIEEHRNLFNEKEIQEINKTQEKRLELRRRISSCEFDLHKLKNPKDEPSIEIAKKIINFNPYDQNKSNNWFDPRWMFGITDGVDIVIGNPPYIQLQKNGGALANLYADRQYQTFERTGDIYALFYEKGVQLLKSNGYFCYITSNKWMRAAYGQSLRAFFNKHNPLMLIDLGPGVFENATVDTNILLLQKAANKSKLQGVSITTEAKNTGFTKFIDQHKTNIPTPVNNAWFIGSSAEHRLKEKIESIGKPLKDWDVDIFYGIKTGLNEAFIIDNKKREEILANCKDKAERMRTETILKPILRGRDIKRYTYNWAGLWVIGTFPSLRLNIKDYPSLKKYFLDQFDIRQLEQSGKKYPKLGFNARKKTGNKWFETQDQIAYYLEFEKEKVVWKALGLKPAFSYVNEHIFINDKANLLTSNSIPLKFICGFFNSVLFQWQFSRIGINMGRGFEYKIQFIDLIFLPPITSANIQIVKQIDSIVSQILSAQSRGRDTAEFEKKIDRLVYQLYNLTPEEIEIVEGKS